MSLTARIGRSDFEFWMQQNSLTIMFPVPSASPYFATPGDPQFPAANLLYSIASTMPSLNCYLFCWPADKPAGASDGIVQPDCRVFGICGSTEDLETLCHTACVVASDHDSLEPPSKRNPAIPPVSTQQLFASLGYEQLAEIMHMSPDQRATDLQMNIGSQRMKAVCADGVDIKFYTFSLPCNPDLLPPWLSDATSVEQLEQKYAAEEYVCSRISSSRHPLINTIHPGFAVHHYNGHMMIDICDTLNSKVIAATLVGRYHQVMQAIKGRDVDSMDRIMRELEATTLNTQPGYGTIHSIIEIDSAVKNIARKHRKNADKTATNHWYETVARITRQPGALFSIFHAHFAMLGITFNATLLASLAMTVAPSLVLWGVVMHCLQFHLGGDFSVGKSYLIYLINKLFVNTVQEQSESPMSSFYGTPYFGTPLHISHRAFKITVYGDKPKHGRDEAHEKSEQTEGMAAHKTVQTEPTGNRVVVRKGVIIDRSVSLSSSNHPSKPNGRVLVIPVDGQGAMSDDMAKLGLRMPISEAVTRNHQAYQECMQRVIGEITIMSILTSVSAAPSDMAATSLLLEMLKDTGLPSRHVDTFAGLARSASTTELLLLMRLNPRVFADLKSDYIRILFAQVWPPHPSTALQLIVFPEQCQPKNIPTVPHALILYKLVHAVNLRHDIQTPGYVSIKLPTPTTAGINSVLRPHVPYSVCQSFYDACIGNGSFVFDPIMGALQVRIKSASIMVPANVAANATKVVNILHDMARKEMFKSVTNEYGERVLVNRSFIIWLSGGHVSLYTDLAMLGDSDKPAYLHSAIAELSPLRCAGMWLALVQCGMVLLQETPADEALVAAFMKDNKTPIPTNDQNVVNMWPRGSATDMVTIPMTALRRDTRFNLPPFALCIQEKLSVETTCTVHMPTGPLQLDANDRGYGRPRTTQSCPLMLYPPHTADDIVSHRFSRDCTYAYVQLIMAQAFNTVACFNPNAIPNLPDAFFAAHPVAREWDGLWHLTADDFDEPHNERRRWVLDNRMCSVALIFYAFGRRDYPPIAAFRRALQGRAAKQRACLCMLELASHTHIDPDVWNTVRTATAGFAEWIAPDLPADVRNEHATRIARGQHIEQADDYASFGNWM